MSLTTEMVKDLVAPLYGEVKPVVPFEKLVFLGSVSLVPFGMIGMVGICQNFETGEKFFFPIPFSLTRELEAAA